MNNRLLHILLIALAVLATLTACNNDACQQNRSSIPLAGFYSMSTKKTIMVDSITVYGVGVPGDSAIVRNGKSVTKAYMPLRISAKSSQFVLKYEQAELNHPWLNDTITFVYESVPFFESAECGAFYKFNVSSLTHTNHLIDSVALTSNEITNVDRETVQIYFRTNE